MAPSTVDLAHQTRSPAIEGAYMPFFGLAVVFYFARFICKVYPTVRLWWDDLALAMAMASEIVVISIAYELRHITGDHHIQFVSLPNIEKALKFIFVLWIFMNMTNIFIKTSLTLMLLRLKKERWWRITLWTLLTLYLVIFVGILLTSFLQCRPVSAFWSLTERTSKCWSDDNVLSVSYGWGSVFVVTDLITSLLPITFIRNIHRPFRERVVIGCLMAAGLIATGASIAKMILFSKVDKSPDFFYSWQSAGIWSFLELSLGIIAACIPTLKAPFDKLLKKMGYSIGTKRSSTYGATAYKSWMSKMGNQNGTVTTTITGGHKSTKSNDDSLRKYSHATSDDSEPLNGENGAEMYVRKSIGVYEEPYKPNEAHLKEKRDY